MPGAFKRKYRGKKASIIMNHQQPSFAKRIHLVKSLQWGLATGVFIVGVSIYAALFRMSYFDGMIFMAFIVGTMIWSPILGLIATLAYLVLFNLWDLITGLRKS